MLAVAPSASSPPGTWKRPQDGRGHRLWPRRWRSAWPISPKGDHAPLVTEDTDVAELFERSSFARVGRAIVVDTQGAPVGIVSTTDVQRAIRSTRLATSQGASMRSVG